MDLRVLELVPEHDRADSLGGCTVDALPSEFEFRERIYRCVVDAGVQYRHTADISDVVNHAIDTRLLCC